MKPESDDRFAATGSVPAPGQSTAASEGGPPAASDPHGLLLAAAAGDQAAFGQLYDLLAPRVYRLIQQVLPDAAQADQVMIEALVEVWRTARSYDADHGSAPDWIYTIAHHHAVSHARALRATAGR
jgi:RNA polymerase sigma-70 factor (ECF subfamily)